MNLRYKSSYPFAHDMHLFIYRTAVFLVRNFSAILVPMIGFIFTIASYVALTSHWVDATIVIFLFTGGWFQSVFSSPPPFIGWGGGMEMGVLLRNAMVAIYDESMNQCLWPHLIYTSCPIISLFYQWTWIVAHFMVLQVQLNKETDSRISAESSASSAKELIKDLEGNLQRSSESSEREKKTLKKELSYTKEDLSLSASKLNAEVHIVRLFQISICGCLLTYLF